MRKTVSLLLCLLALFSLISSAYAEETAEDPVPVQVLFNASYSSGRYYTIEDIITGQYVPADEASAGPFHDAGTYTLTVLPKNSEFFANGSETVSFRFIISTKQIDDPVQVLKSVSYDPSKSYNIFMILNTDWDVTEASDPDNQSMVYSKPGDYDIEISAGKNHHFRTMPSKYIIHFVIEDDTLSQQTDDGKLNHGTNDSQPQNGHESAAAVLSSAPTHETESAGVFSAIGNFFRNLFG